MVLALAFHREKEQVDPKTIRPELQPYQTKTFSKPTLEHTHRKKTGKSEPSKIIHHAPLIMVMTETLTCIKCSQRLESSSINASLYFPLFSFLFSPEVSRDPRILHDSDLFAVPGCLRLIVIPFSVLFSSLLTSFRTFLPFDPADILRCSNEGGGPEWTV
ncbi:hypothetical protein V6N13_111394 [Hibiscus sabdariffa]